MPVKLEEKTLTGLNEKQRKAVVHDKGPLLIIAGAGTGKTAVITRRIAHLISTKRAKPKEILALTFTDKAAAEMEERVDLLVPYGYTDIWISTFHAFGDRLLRENALEFGLDSGFQVLTRADQIIFLREHLYKFDLDYFRPKSDPAKFLQAMVIFFSRLRDEDVSWEEYLKHAQNLEQEAKSSNEDELKENAIAQMELARAYETYQKLLMKEAKVDFANQIYLALHLLRKRPSLLKRYQRQFKYILVDEFQDTNFSQFQIVKLLAQAHKNIVVVGDDNQSIFKFRGAAISNILNFMEYYPKAERIVLINNYRSSQTILDKAYRLIKYNDPDTLEVKCKISKELIASKCKSQLPIRHLHFDTGSSETDEVARLIEEKVGNEGIAYGEIALLVRSNNDADSFLRSMNMRSIPWRFSGNQGLYSQEEVRALISFLRTIADPDDSMSLYHLVSFCGIYNMQMSDLTRCLNWADRKNRSLFSVFKNLDEITELNEITSATREKIKKIIEDIEHYLKESRNLTTGRLLYLFLQQSGYLKRLVKEESLANEQCIKNLARFFSIVANYQNLCDLDRVANFMQHLEMLIKAGDDPATAEAEMDLEAVNVLTIHKAKGLEFEVVFMVNLVQGRFPWPRRRESIEMPLELIKDILPSGDYHVQEERRLFYVGMTRAKRELIFTSAQDYGGKRARKVSQFVYEALDVSPQKPEIIKTRALQEIERFAPRAKETQTKEKPISDDELITLSFRQIDDYLTCPLKYKYVHILRIPILRHHSVVYGSAIHKAILNFYEAKMKKRKYSLDDFLKSFKASWVNEGFLSRAHEEQRFSQGEKTLTQFYNREKDAPLPAAIEQTFNFILGNNKITGRWDRIDERADGAVVIDFKTSDTVKKQKQADKRVKDNLQLSIYALAYKLIKDELPACVELHFVDTALIGHDVRTEADLEKTVKIIEDAASGIRAREFRAKPEYYACNYCAYREVCPYTASTR